METIDLGIWDMDDMTTITEEDCIPPQFMPSHEDSLMETYTGFVIGNVKSNYQGEWMVDEYTYLDNVEQIKSLKLDTGAGRPSREKKMPSKYNDFIMFFED